MGRNDTLNNKQHIKNAFIPESNAIYLGAETHEFRPSFMFHFKPTINATTTAVQKFKPDTFV